MPRLRSPRSVSPQRQTQASRPHSRNVSPSFADSTYSAVHAALSKRQVQVIDQSIDPLDSFIFFARQVHDLQSKLGNARDTIQQLKEQLNQNEADRRHLDQQSTSYKLQIDELRKQFDDTAHERDRSKNALESSHYERTNMEKIRLVSASSEQRSLIVRFFSVQTLNCQIDALRLECDRLQQSNTDLQRQREIVDEEKDDLQKDKIRQVKENERCIKVIENLENKISHMKQDVNELREQYHKEKLTKDVLAQEKHVLCK